MDHNSIMICFDDYNIAHYHRDYKETWYDVENDTLPAGTPRVFSFTVPHGNLGPIYLSIESYM